jgi:adenylate cyclase
MLGALLGLAASLAGVGASLDLRLFDLAQTNLLARPPSQVSLVLVDEDTVTRLGWPFPRDIYAATIDALSRAGARSIALDILMTDEGTEPSSTACADEARGNLALLALVAQSAHATFATHRLLFDGGLPQPATPTPAATHREGGRLAGAVLKPLMPTLANAQVAAGHVEMTPSPVDGRIRSLMPCAPVHDGCALDLAAVATGITTGQPSTEVIVPSFRAVDEFESMTFGELIRLSVDADETIPDRLQRFAKGRDVLFILTDPTLGDFAATARAPREPTGVVLANRIDALRAGRAIRLAPAAPVAWAAAWTVLALLVAASIVRTHLRKARRQNETPDPAMRSWLLAAGGAVVGPPLLSAAVFSSFAVWVPTFALAWPLIGCVFAGTSGAAWRTWKAHQLITHAFGRYVSDEVLDWLKASGAGALRPDAGERRFVTILFSDIVGYSTLSNELKDPDLIMASLRLYLNEMVAVVRAHGGYVDKINGDGIMALFGAPQTVTGVDAEAACAQATVACAQAMHAAVEAMQARWVALTGKPLVIRVGIASGDVVVGNIGGEDHIEYTAIGEPVNRAARHESASVKGGVLLAEETCSRLSRLPPGEWRDVEIKGYDAPQRAYQIPPRSDVEPRR